MYGDVLQCNVIGWGRGFKIPPSPPKLHIKHCITISYAVHLVELMAKNNFFAKYCQM